MAAALHSPVRECLSDGSIYASTGRMRKRRPPERVGERPREYQVQRASGSKELGMSQETHLGGEG